MFIWMTINFAHSMDQWIYTGWPQTKIFPKIPKLAESTFSDTCCECPNFFFLCKIRTRYEVVVKSEESGFSYSMDIRHLKVLKDNRFGNVIRGIKDFTENFGLEKLDYLDIWGPIIQSLMSKWVTRLACKYSAFPKGFNKST